MSHTKCSNESCFFQYTILIIFLYYFKISQNDARIAAGKSPLGFLNPFLYQNPSIFNDVTSGNNPGCSTKGFEASAGWDPVTG